MKIASKYQKRATLRDFSLLSPKNRIRPHDEQIRMYTCRSEFDASVIGLG